MHEPQPLRILSVLDLDIDSIRINPNQPRKYFDEEKLDELSESIRQNGVIEPVIVRPVSGGDFELVAGERRFRAAVQAGLTSIPAVARALDDRQTLEIGLIENIQREDMKPLELAQAYRRLIDEFGMSQEEIARQVGKNRSTVANTLRLLHLPMPILDSLDKGEISEGHARALLSVEDPERQTAIWQQVVEEELSVRETERLSRAPARKRGVARATGRPGHADPNLSDVVDKLRRFLGTKVSIVRHAEKGKIEIEFYDDDDLMRIIDLVSQV
ncbi:MAG: ParB/RepB/Spo0J family partition protein [Armatimonadota bacterium]